MKVLFVDDNRSNRYLVERLLIGHGHSCVSVTNGAEALSRLERESFDVVLSDILMPEMDGFQLCRTLRGNSSVKRIPFVFYTATYTDDKDREFALALGADEFLAKPVEYEQVLAALERVQAPERTPPVVEAEAPADFYERYSQRLVERLEHKVVQLDERNRELSAEVGRRRQAERNARESLALLRATVDGASDGVLAVLEGRIVLENALFRSCWGLPRADALPERWEELEPQLRGRVRSRGDWERFEQALSSGFSRADAVPLELSEGRALEARWMPLRLSSSSRGRVFNFRDVTRQRAAATTERELQRQLMQSQKMESVGIMAASIAHDFNNVLTAMVGSAEQLSSDLSARGLPMAEEAEAVYRAALAGVELAGRIVAFSQERSFGQRRVDLAVIVRQTAKLLSLMTPPTVELVVEATAGEHFALADSVEIQQLVLNLGANGLDAMPEGGALRLEVRREQQGGEEGVCICVSDTGAGMTRETAARLFEPFFTTKPEGKGTGLGLAIVRRILADHGAKITVASELDRGTTFRAFFPDRSGEVPEEPEAEAGLERTSVLLISLHAAEGNAVSQALGEGGFAVETAVSARSGVHAFRRSPDAFAAVVVDEAIEGEKVASQVCRLLRAIRPDLPLVVITGFVSSGDWAAGSTPFQHTLVLRPWSSDALNRAVRAALRES